MTNIKQILDDKIKNLLDEYSSLGGVIDFKFFRVTDAIDEFHAHLFTAQATLQELANDNDNYFYPLAEKLGTIRENYFKVTFNPNLVVDKQLSPEQFFGPFFNFKEQRPILLGKVGKQFGDYRVFSDYFYYDTEESNDKIVSVELLPIYKECETDFSIKGYADAFLQPPHTFGSNKSCLELVNYFLDFNRTIFDDFNKIVVYSWSIECSNYFDAGKEWWGSYFWTAYNPKQDLYIGITASTTD